MSNGRYCAENRDGPGMRLQIEERDNEVFPGRAVKPFDILTFVQHEDGCHADRRSRFGALG